MRTDSLAQYSVFDYTRNDNIGDLERLNICLNVMPYQQLISVLDQERGLGRNDYPNLTMFFIIIAMLLFEQQINYEHMRRTLSGNPTLRELVGLNDEELKCKDMPLIPSEDVFTHFVDNLAKHTDNLDEIMAIQLKNFMMGLKVLVNIPQAMANILIPMLQMSTHLTKLWTVVVKVMQHIL